MKFVIANQYNLPPAEQPPEVLDLDWEIKTAVVGLIQKYM